MWQTMDVDSFRRAVHQLLKARGFKRSGMTWRRQQSESLAVLNVQKSNWGPEYYVNVGVFFSELDNVSNPKEYECHVRGRVEPVDPAATVEAAMLWFEARQTIAKAKILAREDSNHGLVSEKLLCTAT
jgi:hypothetical protein